MLPERPDGARPSGRAGCGLIRAGHSPVAVGHRVVHGGPAYATPVPVDDDVIAELEALVPLAPLHQPNNLAARSGRSAQRRPDSAAGRVLRHGLSPRPSRGGRPLRHPGAALPGGCPPLRLPRPVLRVHRADRCPSVAPELASGRVVVAHLGSGASMCAIHDGRSVDSTMGFTALDGLPMGTRPGQLDPGVVLLPAHRTRAWTADAHRALALP